MSSTFAIAIASIYEMSCKNSLKKKELCVFLKIKSLIYFAFMFWGKSSWVKYEDHNQGITEVDRNTITANSKTKRTAKQTEKAQAAIMDYADDHFTTDLKNIIASERSAPE